MFGAGLNCGPEHHAILSQVTRSFVTSEQGALISVFQRAILLKVPALFTGLAGMAQGWNGFSAARISILCFRAAFYCAKTNLLNPTRASSGFIQNVDSS
jgi:hypothetical protein